MSRYPLMCRAIAKRPTLTGPRLPRHPMIGKWALISSTRHPVRYNSSRSGKGTG
ncbi:MAG: hypothetical protein Q8N94_06865 [Methanoregula sp.]|nr:hypothetical protein [Methanoregula sp.]